MAAGKISIQANDGSIVGAYVPDGLGSGDRALSFGPSLSGITAYHLLQGNLAVSASTTTQGFNTTLYTGNGTTKSITTGVDMDTQWGNDASEKFGGLVWQKYRSVIGDNTLIDSVRGAGKYISTNTTGVQGTDNNSLSSFSSNGFNIGASWSLSGATAASWNFQTTHRVSGTTNHGKAFTCHYNPFTGFTMVKYEGSGLIGHEIPHMLGRKLSITVVKNLTATTNWSVWTQATGTYTGYLNLTQAINQDADINANGGYDDKCIINSTNSNVNTSSNSYIMYGWANSYFDKANKLIGNYEVGVYQGTGASGNKVTTRGKPAWVIVRRLDGVGNWAIYDNKRANDGHSIYANTPDAEYTASDLLNFVSDGFISTGNYSDNNTSGGQYLYLVAYDTNSNGGGSYYPLASDTANLQVNNAIIPFANGIDSNGTKNTILSKNETITGLTYTAGKNYVYCDSTGAYGVSAHKPRYLESELIRTYAGETPDYYNVKENKWYSTSGGSELLGTTGWTATGGTLTTVDGYNQFVDTTLTGYVSKTISTVVGKAYTIVLKTFGTREANITINNVEYQWVNGTFIGTKTINFVANGVATVIAITDGSGASYTIQFSASMFETAITPSTAITNSRNYMNTIVYADNDGGLLYVEELPKIEYKDIVKANEFKGKNACTAWVNFDGTTTPPTIRDSYNVKSVIRTGTGNYDVYFEEVMDNRNYVVGGTAVKGDTNDDGNYIVQAGGCNTNYLSSKTIAKVAIKTRVASDLTAVQSAEVQVQIFGGKN